MKQQQYKTLGHEVLYNVAQDSTEFNSLDTKRTDAACIEANNNIVYRVMNPYTRNWFLHGIDEKEIETLKKDYPNLTVVPYEGAESEFEKMLEGVDLGFEKDKAGNPTDVKVTASRKTEVVMKDGKPRMKDNEEVTKYIESQEQYYNRALSLVVEHKKFASEDVARAHFDPIVKRLAASVPFDVTEREVGERGPKKLAAKYKIAAAKAITKGTTDKLNTGIFVNIGKTYTATNDTTKMFAGKFPEKDATTGEEKQVDFNVSDKDAEALGWLIKEYQDWKSTQELASLAE